VSSAKIWPTLPLNSYSSRDELQIKTVIDHDLKELDEWSKKWLMSFNPDKTEIIEEIYNK
jgi:hypothetical protein